MWPVSTSVVEASNNWVVLVFTDLLPRLSVWSRSQGFLSRLQRFALVAD